MGDIEEIPIETPTIKIKKPRSEKQIEAFQKALAKKAELSLINKQFNDAKKQQKEDVVEFKKKIIKNVKEVEPAVEVEVELEVDDVEVHKSKFKRKTKKKIPVPVEESSSESEEEEIIVKRKAKPKKKKPIKKIIYEDTSSEESGDDDAQIVNMAKVIKKSARERLKEELNMQKMNQAMQSLGYI
jgi:hypothetical protein